MRKLLLILMIFGLSVGLIYSQEKQAEDVEDISLEDMLNVEVTTATKSKVTISEAPAIISVITADQIERLGVRKLSDVLNYVPGFTMVDSYWKPDIIVARGVRPTLYNDKVLMLINGIPAYDAASMEFFLDTVPIDGVDKIEIIRGPGSTLYGTNAFAGVINVITKKEGANHARIGYGSFDTKEAGLFFNRKVGKVSFTFSASMRDDTGFMKEAADEAGIEGKNIYERDIHSFFGSMSYEGFTVQVGHGYQRFGKFGPTPRFAFGNNFNTESGKATHLKSYINIFYEKTFGKLDTKFTVHYDDTDKQSAIGTFGAIYELLGVLEPGTAPDVAYYRFGGTCLLGEFQAQYGFKNHTLTAGVSFEKRETKHLADMYDDLNGNLLASSSTQDLPFDTNDLGGYLQLDGKLTKQLGYIAGVRFTKLGINDKWYTTPRGGLVYSFTKNSSVKVLFGEAFRSPGPQEQYYSVAGIIYGPDLFGSQLEPERIRTIEAAIDTTLFKRFKLLANVFTTTVFDIIGRRDSTAEEYAVLQNNAKVYGNLGDQKLKGFEIELKGFPKVAEISDLFVNMSYKDGEEDNGDDIPYLAKLTANAGITFKLFKKLDLSLMYQFIGKREGSLTNGTAVSVDSYSLLNVSAGLNLDKQFKLGLNVTNLTDAEYFYPEFVRRGMATIPGGPGRSVVFWVKYHLK